MKKRTTCLLCLAAGLLVGAGIAAPSAAALAKADGASLIAAASHAIAVSAPAGVTVTVDSSAEAGKIVDILVETDANVAAIKSVRANGLLASNYGEGKYQFVMPDQDVTIAVEAELNDEDNRFAIDYTKANGLNLIGLPASALAGDMLSFRITFDALAGYTWNGAVAVYAQEEEGDLKLALSEDAGLYTFQMPAADVMIEVGSEKRQFIVEKSIETIGVADALNVFGDIEIVTPGEVTEENPNPDPVLDTLIDAGLYSVRGRTLFGNKIRVNLTPSNSFIPLGIEIMETGEELMLENDATYVEFDMPGRNIHIEPIVETRYYDINLVASEHVSLGLYHEVGDENGNINMVKDTNGDIAKVCYYETVYIKAIAENGYGASRIHLIQTPASGSGVSRDLQMDANGYYPFTSSGVYTFSSVTVTEAAFLEADKVAIEQSEHLNATILLQDGNDLVPMDAEHGLFPGAVAYVGIESNSEDYGDKLVSGTFSKANEEGNATLAIAKATSGLGKGLWSFTVPENAVGINLAISEQLVFNKYGIVGDYTAKNFGINDATMMTSNTYMNVVNPAGTFVMNYSNSIGIASINPAANGAEYGLISGVKGSTSYSGGRYVAPNDLSGYDLEGAKYLFGYTDRMIFWQGTGLAAASNDAPIAASASSFTAAFKNDANKEEELEISAIKITVNDELLLIAMAAYEDGFYAGFVYNYTTGNMKAAGIEIVMNSGAALNDPDANFAVKDNGQTLYLIATKDGLPTLLDGLQGCYNEGLDDELILDGVGHATYGNNEWAYKVTGEGEILLTREEETDEGLVKHSIEVLVDANALTAVLGQEVAADPLPWKIMDGTDYIHIDGSEVRSGFSYNAENGTYSSLNYHVNYGISEMSIKVFRDGLFTFDYALQSEANYDFGRVYLNEEIEIDNFSGNVNGHASIAVEADDIITIIYRKDSSGNGSGNDTLTISNLAHIMADGLAGEYALEDESIVELDGFGTATYNGKDFAYGEEDGAIKGTLDLGVVTTEDGKVNRTLVFTFNTEAKTARIETIDTPLAVGNPVVNLGETYAWTYDAANETYTSGCAGVNSGESTITFTFSEDGTFSFHYRQSAEGAWDYAVFELNGAETLSLKGSGSTVQIQEDDYSIEVHAGDVFSITYSKDGYGNYGDDCIVISNVVQLLDK